MLAGKAVGMLALYSAAGARLLMQASGNPIRLWCALLSIPEAELSGAVSQSQLCQSWAVPLLQCLLVLQRGHSKGILLQLASLHWCEHMWSHDVLLSSKVLPCQNHLSRERCTSHQAGTGSCVRHLQRSMGVDFEVAAVHCCDGLPFRPKPD